MYAKPLNLRISKALLSLTLFALLGLTRCGQIGLGTARTDDPVPPGTVVAIKEFTTYNSSKAVTGTAAVYLRSDTNTYLIRLENLSAPGDSGLLVVGKANGGTVFQTTLRARTGNQNYETGKSGNMSWTSVAIRPSAPATAPDYAEAIFGQ